MNIICAFGCGQIKQKKRKKKGELGFVCYESVMFVELKEK